MHIVAVIVGVYLGFQLPYGGVETVGRRNGASAGRLGIARHGADSAGRLTVGYGRKRGAAPRLYLGPKVGEAGLVKKFGRHALLLKEKASRSAGAGGRRTDRDSDYWTQQYVEVSTMGSPVPGMVVCPASLM